MSAPETDTYKIGDYIYLDLLEPREPFWICMIEEIQVTEDCNVQIKVKQFYRRTNLSENLLKMTDKYTDCFINGRDFNWERAESSSYIPDYVQLHFSLLQRMLFVSKESIIISPDIIRGRCNVMLLTVVDCPADFLEKEDEFFFLLAFDPDKQEVFEDKGSIMAGSQYQAELPDCNKPAYNSDSPKETILWSPDKCSDADYDNLICMARSLHALKQFTDSKASPSQAYRDAYLQRALELFSRNNYDLQSTASELIRESCTSDDTDSWTSDEVLIFERAVHRYGKQFHYIRQHFLPWKSGPGILKFYHRWKNSENYKIWKIANGGRGDVKELKIGGSEWIYPLLTGFEADVVRCPGCSETPENECWVSWSSTSVPIKICKSCSKYWKRYAGFPNSQSLEPGNPVIPGPKPSNMDPYQCDINNCSKRYKSKSSLTRHKVKVHNIPNFASIYLCTTEMLKMRRRYDRDVFCKIARRPCRNQLNIPC